MVEQDSAPRRPKFGRLSGNVIASSFSPDKHPASIVEKDSESLDQSSEGSVSGDESDSGEGEGVESRSINRLPNLPSKLPTVISDSNEEHSHVTSPLKVHLSSGKLPSLSKHTSNNMSNPGVKAKASENTLRS